MARKPPLAGAWLFASVLALSACGGDDDMQSGGGAAGSASGGAVLTDGDADACEQDCDAQVAAGCERMPPEYATACKALCEGLRQSTPAECQAALRAQSQCAVDRAVYVCSEGIATVTQQGVCAREAAACAACRGTVCIPGL